ncbi:helix-turn-helix domain-containing protein [Paenibacillus sp. 2TAB23]|uniref:helix-turn-helix domain-containing protein n=1 Tax=Paenibacillus sp. 2TAB23 TaxID=3233004 RepID=UPI003F9B1855
MGFSTKVKNILAEKEMNPSELARQTGYSPQYIHDLLKGDKRWNEETMSKVCGALDLEITINSRKR